MVVCAQLAATRILAQLEMRLRRRLPGKLLQQRLASELHPTQPKQDQLLQGPSSPPQLLTNALLSQHRRDSVQVVPRIGRHLLRKALRSLA